MVTNKKIGIESSTIRIFQHQQDVTNAFSGDHWIYDQNLEMVIYKYVYIYIYT